MTVARCAAAVVLVVAAGCTAGSPARPAPTPGARPTPTAAVSGSPTAGDDAPLAVATFGQQSQDHVDGPVDYEQTPPVGGPHAGEWQNCGFYAEPVAPQNAVHSMEHGAVWITYSPDVDPAPLQAFAEGDYVLVSPFDGLPAPVVASAWGVQLAVDGPDDPRLAAFVGQYAQGPQTPEPGAPCDGGVGEPGGVSA